MLQTIIDFVKQMASKETARLAAYGGVALMTGAIWLGKFLGVEVPPEVVTGAQALGVLIVTEIIRHFVTAPGNL